MGSISLKNTKKRSSIQRVFTSNANKKEMNLTYSGKNSFPIKKVSSLISLRDIKTNSNELSYESNNITKLSIQKKANLKNDKNESQIIKKILSNHYLFKYVDNDSITKLMNKLIKCKSQKGIKIYEKNKESGYFYIITKGKMYYNAKNNIEEKIKEYQDLNIYSPSCFGDYELINNISRLCDVITEEECIFYALKKDDLLDILFNVRKKNMNKINKFINENYPFLSSYPEANKFLINSITIYNFNKSGVLISNSFDEMINNNIFIISDGEVDIIYKQEIAKVLRKGDIIGYRELILNDGYLRNIYLASKTDDVELYSISYNSIISFLKENYYINDVLFFIFCFCWKKSQFLNELDVNTLYKIFPFFKMESYGPNEKIFKKGECLTEENIVIIEGNILCETKSNYEAVRNEILYEKELVFSSNAVLVMDDLYAFPETIILRCPRQKYMNVLGGKSLSDIVNSNTKKKITHTVIIDLLKKLNCFNTSKIKVKELEKYLNIEKYHKKVPIINQGSTDLSKIYMIKNGYVDIYINNKYIRTLSMNSPFGFKSIIMGNKIRTASAIANSLVELYSIDYNAFDKYVLNENPNIITFLKNKVYLEDETVELEDLENIRLLGKGSFGFVSLVRSKKTKYLYAIKSIPLQKIMQLDMYECITNEKNALRMLDHNFILKQVKTLKNSDNIFFLNEYIKGKNLNDILKEIITLNKSQAQFFSASIILSIEYMHSNKLIHRDIKPENIMISESGYIKLIDFGTVKETSSLNGRTHTQIGTPHYMAPEVIRGDSYDNKVDYWSIGICIFEFICGKKPFGNDIKDPIEIYKSILNDKITFPNFIKDKDFIYLINNMLEKDEKKRIFGSDVKEMEWFKDFDFKGLNDMNIQAPMKINLGNDNDDKGSSSNRNSNDYLSELKNLIQKYKKGKENIILTDAQIQKGESWLKDF